MMAKTMLQLDDRQIVCHENESVLETLITEGIDINYSCQQGLCQNCMMRCLEGKPPDQSQAGLSDDLKQQNMFLACVCYPDQALRIGFRHHTDFTTYGSVSGLQQLNNNTLLLQLTLDDAIDYVPGQFVKLRRSDGLSRSYSIANHQLHSHKLSFHIRHLVGGQFSEWVHQSLQIGDRLAVSEALGNCFYKQDNLEQPMLLIGTGSGLAPLFGIIHDALRRNHQGQIHLYHGSQTMNGLYWVKELQQLADKHDNFYYAPCLSKEDPGNDAKAGRANDVAFATLTDLKGWQVFLCGHPQMVNDGKMQAFLKGATLKDIYADPFHIANH